MIFFIMIIAAILPAILLWYNIYRKDQKPEPKRLLIKAVLYGVLISLPIIVAEDTMSFLLLDSETENTTLIEAVVDAFFVTALPEEGFKLLALWLIVRKNPFFDEHFDGIVYAVCVGLGFAGLENLMYIFGETDGWAEVALMRALMSVPGHYVFAVLMGYYYSVYHFINHSFHNKMMIIGAPVLAHGIYDALLMISGDDVFLILSCFVICIIFCFKIHKIANKKIKKLLDEAS